MDSPASTPRPRILLVDDIEINRDVVGRLLTSVGYEVDVASDGETACAVTWSKIYDLVLMDIEMPGMNGFEAAARIRAREGVMSGVKIAAFTATIQPEAEQYAFWSGIDEFIAKPIEPKTFLARVGKMVAEGSPGTNDWKPVWRLAVFAKFTGRLDDEDAEDYLHEFLSLLDVATASIDTKTSTSADFFRTVRDLRNLASLLGFEEIAGICAILEDARERKDSRCRDLNLLGAIDRARYAINVYQRERNPTPFADWWTRTRVNVQSLFRGKTMMANPSAANV